MLFSRANHVFSFSNALHSPSRRISLRQDGFGTAATSGTNGSSVTADSLVVFPNTYWPTLFSTMIFEGSTVTRRRTKASSTT